MEYICFWLASSSTFGYSIAMSSRETNENTLKQKAIAVASLLDCISPEKIVFLKQDDPFRLLVCVILSAQTTDNQVNKVAETLFTRYPEPKDLANADLEEVKNIIRSTGYYNTKAAHIIGTAQQLVSLYGGKVPLGMKDLTTLPGVGRKTANCILGQIAKEPAIIVDTHFGRVVRRLGLTVAKEADQVERELADLLPPETQYRFSMTANLHGRTICLAKKPQCNICKLAPYCDSYPLSNV
jgi:endonuclease III